MAVADGLIIPGSSMVEQEAVNFEVAGSSPAPGANLHFLRFDKAQKTVLTEMEEPFFV